MSQRGLPDWQSQKRDSYISIILGGSVSRDFRFFEKAMRERMKIFPYRKILERIVIEVSEKPRIAVLGATALYYDARMG